MLLLTLFAFIAGVVTVLSPCILPLLPIILSSSVNQSSDNIHRPLGVIAGFIGSFTFFTLALATIVQSTGIPVDVLRTSAVIVVAMFGVSLALPRFQHWIETMFGKISRLMPAQTNRRGLPGGILIGMSLGLLWTPCVGPILAAVISLAISGSVTSQATIITLAYATGTAIPMFAIMLGGRRIVQKIPNPKRIQQTLGIMMVILAFAIAFNIDRQFQTLILDTFPQYSELLTQIDDRPYIRELLKTVEF